MKLDISTLAHVHVGGVHLQLLTYDGVQPLTVRIGETSLFGVPAAAQDTRDEDVFRSQSGTGWASLQPFTVLGIASVLTALQCTVNVHGLGAFAFITRL